MQRFKIWVEKRLKTNRKERSAERNLSSKNCLNYWWNLFCLNNNKGRVVYAGEIGEAMVELGTTTLLCILQQYNSGVIIKS